MTDLIIPRFTSIDDIPKCDKGLMNYKYYSLSCTEKNMLVRFSRTHCASRKLQTIVNLMNKVLPIDAICDWGHGIIYISYEGSMEIASILLKVMIGDIPNVEFRGGFLGIKL